MEDKIKKNVFDNRRKPEHWEGKEKKKKEAEVEKRKEKIKKNVFGQWE